MKKIVSLLLFSFTVLFCWFSFLKKYDHQLRFEVNLPAGSAYNLLSDSLIWENRNQKISNPILFESFSQNLEINNTLLEMYWEFIPLDVKKTKIILNYKDTKNSFTERYKSLFKNSKTLDSLRNLALDIKRDVSVISDNFRVEIVGVDSIPATTYLYVKDSCSRSNKAFKMINNNALLFSKNHDTLVQKSGNTFVKIDRWDMQKDTISFRYAFPIKPQQQYPTDEFVMVDSLPKQLALKAIFYGNYSISDQAWIAMYHYAKNNYLKLDYSPVEIYYNNPIYGGDDREWKAEIYFPIKNP